MRRVVFAIFGIAVGCWYFQNLLAYCFPAWRMVYGGYVFGQAIILGGMAALVFGFTVALAYQFLNWIFE